MHPTCQNVQVAETLTGFSHVGYPDSLNNTVLSQGGVPENGSLCGAGPGGWGWAWGWGAESIFPKEELPDQVVVMASP